MGFWLAQKVDLSQITIKDSTVFTPSEDYLLEAWQSGRLHRS